jgi:hypothetical protein
MFALPPAPQIPPSVMPSPNDPPKRKLLHRRSLQVEIYALGDERWEVCAELTDVKTRDHEMVDGPRHAGTPIHDLRLRLVIDAEMNVLESGSNSVWVPYPGHCAEHGDAYAALTGLNLARGFRRELLQRLGGTLGCTHLTELAQVLPSAVIQGMVGETIHPRNFDESTTPPFPLDRCHALRRDREVVRLHYPRWYRQPHANKGIDNASEQTGHPLR